MKTLTALTVLILSLSPAAKLRSLRDVPQIHAWQDAYGVCVYSTDEPKVAKACPAFDRLKKKMEAKGYCMVGHAEVGRASKDKKHCYTITNLPDPEQWNLTLDVGTDALSIAVPYWGAPFRSRRPASMKAAALQVVPVK